jgi:alpha-galactosidase
LWRTTGDITDKWEGKYDYSNGMLNIVDMNEPLYAYAGPGHWNDPDMLEVGNGGMTGDEYRAHFSLWAMMAAPLIAGNDIANMTPETRSILENKEVIAVDQDALGQAGRRVRKDGDLEVWSRELADGSRAVVLLNRGKAASPMTLQWTDVGYPSTVSAKVRDLWQGKDLGEKKQQFVASVPSHGVVMLTLRP